MAWFKMTVTMGLVGCKRTCTFEVPDEDLEGLEGFKRESMIGEYADDELRNIIDYEWEPCESPNTRLD